MEVILSPSTRSSKKWMVKINNRTIHFGAKGMSDFTINNDPKRKASYITRHRKRENWNDPKTAGFWSRWLLWEKTTLPAAIKNIERTFNLKIKRKVNAFNASNVRADFFKSDRRM